MLVALVFYGATTTTLKTDFEKWVYRGMENKLSVKRGGMDLIGGLILKREGWTFLPQKFSLMLFLFLYSFIVG